VILEDLVIVERIDLFADSGLTYLSAIILGIIQGITEFLPISSSGHLALAEHLMIGVPEDFALDVFLHFATVLVVIFHYRKAIWDLFVRDHKTLILIIVGSIPVGILGVFFKSPFEAIKSKPDMICLALIFTSALLFFGERLAKCSYSLPKLSYKGAFAIGLVQGIALTPGISRSGSTTVAGLLCGLDRESAVRFSLFLMMPAVLGASLLEAKKVFFSGSGEVILNWGPMCVGFLVSLVMASVSLKILINVVTRGWLKYFAAYCLTVGVIGWVYFFIFAG